MYWHAPQSVGGQCGIQVESEVKALFGPLNWAFGRPLTPRAAVGPPEPPARNSRPASVWPPDRVASLLPAAISRAFARTLPCASLPRRAPAARRAARRRYERFRNRLGC